MKVKVQFPEDKNNKYWDGKQHVIVPEKLQKIGSSNTYVMYGHDETFGFGMFTLLEKKDNKFSKLPLVNSKEYSVLDKFLEDQEKIGGLHDVDTEVLNEDIGCLPNKAVNTLISELSNSKSL